jgi:hypothetical protein
MDLFLANGTAFSNIYLNQGNGTFVDLAAKNPTPAVRVWRSLIGTAGAPENRARIMHSFLALFLALAGGHISRFLHARRRATIEPA